MKRALDIVLGSAALLVAAPLIAVCGALVKLGSPGPAFYGAERIGRGERPFRQYKLRTMRVGAETAGFRTADADPRITRIGRFLRATSLDELPQLINVLRGEMSLIGPRPPVPYEVQQYKEWHKRRLEAHPGITGLWQVSGRNDLTFEEWMALDLQYVDNWSLGLDLAILLRTVPAVLGARGAR